MRVVVGLDVGSSSIKAIIGEINKDGGITIHRVLKFASDGIRKGMIDDVAVVTRNLSAVFAEIKQFSKDAVKNIYVSLGSPNVRLQASRGIIAVSRADLEIYPDDVARVREAAESIKLPANRMVIHSMTDEFAIDDISNIKDQIGMIGNRLEAKSLIVDAFAPAVKTLMRAVEVAGGGLSGMIFNPIASARSVLTKNQKDLGVILLDNGSNTTSYAGYQEGKLMYTSSLHLGSSHVTNDLAIGLKTSITAAENIKFSFGAALAKDVPLRESVELVKFDANARGASSRRFIAEIIEVRLAEIFEFINNDLKAIGRAGQLPAGVVLTGGGAKLPGLTDLVIQELRLPARIGMADLSLYKLESEDLSEILEDPEYACALGLVSWGAEKMLSHKNVNLNILSWAKGLVDYFMP